MPAVSGSIRLPPPSPIERTSGIRNNVRTPPTRTEVLAWRGKPVCRCPKSAVVPPTSTTTAFCTRDRYAAPRIELVGPEAKLNTGNIAAWLAAATVPSFWVIYSGAAIPVSRIARSKPPIVSCAKGMIAAFSTAAFSRSSRPIPPSIWEHVTEMPGISSRRISATAASSSWVSGENIAVTAAWVTPRARMSRAAARTAAMSSGMKRRPS
jgi:hypothetical protein